MLQRSGFSNCALRLQVLQQETTWRPTGTPSSSSHDTSTTSARPPARRTYSSHASHPLATSVKLVWPRHKRRHVATAVSPAVEDVTATVPPAVSSPAPSSNEAVAPAKPKDELQALMRHPALYDPILVPRNPIVLCHGLYGYDRFGLPVSALSSWQWEYWSAVLDVLKNRVGAEVIAARVPRTGSIEGRAKALDLVLRKEVQGRNVNLLAHSMGGLDARYLISNIKPTEYNVVSLTTVCTPHRGSPFMDWCSEVMGIGRDRSSHPPSSDIDTPAARKSTLEYWMGVGLAQYFADLFDSPAYRDLAPSFLEKRFNPATIDSPNVRYFSVAARTPEVPIFHGLSICKRVMDAAEARLVKEGKAPEEALRGNDGLVTVSSAKWGEFLGVVDGCDHWLIRGASGFARAPPRPEQVAQRAAEAASKAAESAKEVVSPLPSPTSSTAVKLDVNDTDTVETMVEMGESAGTDSGKPKIGKSVGVAEAKSRSWSWEDVNVYVSPLLTPFKGLLSLGPLRTSSSLPPVASGTSLTSTTRFSSFLRPSFNPLAEKPRPPLTPTTRFFELSLVMSPRPPPPSGLAKVLPLNLTKLVSFSLSDATETNGKKEAKKKAVKGEEFDLERLYVALARKLYLEGF